MKALLILVMTAAAFGVSLEDRYKAETGESICSEGSKWKADDCNWCRCIDGMPACTKRLCRTKLAKSTFASQSEETECSGDPDTTRWRIECNWCRCINGKGSCTRKGCPQVIMDRLVNTSECEGSPTWTKGCNTCSCVNGRAQCTTEECGESPSVTTRSGRQRVNAERHVPTGSLPDNAVCEPGSRWMDKCNWCTCGKDGNAGCTEKGCLDDYEHPPGEPVCDDGSRWIMDNCNWCTCHNGSAACTEKLCIERIPGRSHPGRSHPGRSHPGRSHSGRSVPDNAQCVPGSRWKNDCNWCSCTETGLGMCTLMGCFPNYKPIPGVPVCDDGSRWKVDDCNWCTCSNGSAICTEKLCQQKVPDESIPDDALCVPGSRWLDKCNWCWCADNFGAACTLKGCPENYLPIPGNPVCDDGSKWKMDDCNWCTCSNGSAICTEKLCIKPGEQCTEGESWRDDCNVCHCSNGHATCTQKACVTPVERSQPCRGETENGCSIQELPPHCKLPPSITGGIVCAAYIPKWTYDFISGKCQAIIYGGCGGTKNLYDTEEECKASCSLPPANLPHRTGRKVSKRPERCFQKQDAGPCFAFLVRYFYNEETKMCEEFIYGGCSGNTNRFTTLEECLETCENVARDLGSSCDRSRCPWTRWAHYFAKNCLPRYERGSCCPTSFACPSADAADPEKCSYRGQVYPKGSNVPVEYSCTANCICTDSYVPGFPVEIHCAEIECPEFFMPPKPGCRPLYKPGQCCSSESDCVDPDTPPLLESRSATCVWNNRTYLEGDKMYFEDFPCHQCICSPAFTDPNGPLCFKVNCGLDFRYTSKYTEGCVPIYFEEKCCPIDWLCPGDGRISLPKVVDPKSGIAENLKATQAVECYLGSLNIGLGSALNTSECNLNCRCITPPEPTCVQYRSCTLAQEAELIQECAEPSCATGCDIIMDAATGCLVCSCKDETFVCPQHTCPSNCENVLDLQTGCLLCKCDCSYDFAGHPHCPVDCDVYEFVDKLTGCKRCECNLNGTSSTSVTRQLCPVDFSGRAPCPMDCAIRRVVDETTGCEKCECDPEKTINPFRPHELPPRPPLDINCPTYATGQEPCPMDCAIRRVVDEKTGCEICECDPNNPGHPFGPHSPPYIVNT